MTYLRFGIRDLLWAMVVVGLLGAWWVDRGRLATRVEALVQHIYLTEGRYADWNDEGQLVVSDK